MTDDILVMKPVSRYLYIGETVTVPYVDPGDEWREAWGEDVVEERINQHYIDELKFRTANTTKCIKNGLLAMLKRFVK